MTAPQSPFEHPFLARLPDVAAGVLSFAVEAKAAGDPGSFETFRSRVEEVFTAFEARAKELGSTEEDVGLAKYALAAFIDEGLLGSTWSFRDAWAGEPLTLKYFNDTAAGEEFYEKLNELQSAEDPRKIEVLEVYYLCLALGFTGKYGDVRGMAKLRSLITTLSKKIQGGAAAKAPELAPASLPSDRGPGLTTTVSTWVIAVGCLAVLLIIYIALAAVLSHRAGGLVDTLRGL